jgi:ATP-dependent DNA helicase RecQ
VCLEPPQTWDGTVAAQKLMSAVLRTGSRFGAGHLIDVLRGKATDRVKQLRHDGLPTFGVGAGLDESAWRGVARQLVALGLLRTDAERYGSNCGARAPSSQWVGVPSHVAMPTPQPAPIQPCCTRYVP